MRVKNTFFSYENICFSLSIGLASGSRVEERGFIGEFSTFRRKFNHGNCKKSAG